MSTGAAAPITGRRPPRGLLGALVAFLLLPFPALFLLGPLGGLLALARPATFREWGLLLSVVLLGAMAGAVGDSLAQAVTLAAGLVFTGAFLALLVSRPGPALPRATAAATLTAVTLVAGCAWLGLSWEEVRSALDAQWQNGLTLLLRGSTMPAAQEATMRQGLSAMATVFPGLAFLGALAGGTLATALTGHLADRTGVDAPDPFTRFRFNDHLIWAALLALLLVMLGLPAPWDALALNLLVAWAGLYAARGLAVWLARAAGWPTPLRLALFLSAVLLLPYALGGLLVLGVADTWLDIRREQPPSEGVNS